MADSDDAMDLYVFGVWDAIAYVNEHHRTELNPLVWSEVLAAIEAEKEAFAAIEAEEGVGDSDD